MNRSTPYKECPQFEGCSRNHCPLDPERGLRENLPDDPDTKCRAIISVRKRIAEKHKLAGGGMTEKEVRRAERKAKWDALPEEEKDRRLATLKLLRERLPGRGDTPILTGF